MKKINDWVIRTFGLRGSWSWAKKQMLNGAIIKRKATILPDDYLDGIAPNTAMSLTGNGWTVDVIAHLLKGIECR